MTDFVASLPPSIALSGRNRFGFSAWLFLRSLAIIHLVAFLSYWPQFTGLVGPHGILPASTFLPAVHEHLGNPSYLRLPTLCWIFGTGSFLHVLCAVGVAAAVLLFVGIAPALCLAVLWACYLSLVNVSQIFLGFQWDALLLEVTFFAIFLAPRTLRPGWRRVEPPQLARGLLLWLLLRLMILSGVVKFSSGDPTWRALTALTFHYETQPLPNPVAWWLHQFPAGAHRAACAGMFVIELFVPLFLFTSRTLRHNAALILAALQVAILLSGNYAFFNLIPLALCLLALDEAWWQSVSRGRILPTSDEDQRLRAAPSASRFRSGLFALPAIFIVVYTTLLAGPAFNRNFRWPSWFHPLVGAISPFGSLNNYGLFAVMTTARPELIIEGSDDRREWHAYKLPHKPGDLARPPTIVAPHQPRLDWQLWFAALGSADQNPWVFSLCEHLLHGTPEVLALFVHNPFPDRPPRAIRVVRYDYHFTTTADRTRTGHWWRRTPLDFYVPPTALK